MQSMKKLVGNGLIVLGLVFGLIVSAVAQSDFEEDKAIAEQGNAFYQSVLGTHYFEGDGVKQDYAKAFYWHLKSARQGDRYGQFNAAHAYYTGKGVRQDYTKALYWYRKSADQNNSSAQGVIGDAYEYGKGVKQNKNTAKAWYGKSCDNGNQVGCDFYRRLNEQGY